MVHWFWFISSRDIGKKSKRFWFKNCCFLSLKCSYKIETALKWYTTRCVPDVFCSYTMLHRLGVIKSNDMEDFKNKSFPLISFHTSLLCMYDLYKKLYVQTLIFSVFSRGCIWMHENRSYFCLPSATYTLLLLMFDSISVHTFK